MRQDPVPWAYRVFYRQVGIDPTPSAPPAEEVALERLRAGGFTSRNNVDDALTIAVAETGVPVIALDRDKVGTAIGLRLAREDERLGPRRPLSARQIVVADEDRALAVLFGEIAEDAGVTPSTRRMVLAALRVKVPAISVEEALWTAAEHLWAMGRRSRKRRLRRATAPSATPRGGPGGGDRGRPPARRRPSFDERPPAPPGRLPAERAVVAAVGLILIIWGVFSGKGGEERLAAGIVVARSAAAPGLALREHLAGYRSPGLCWPALRPSRSSPAWRSGSARSRSGSSWRSRRGLRRCLLWAAGCSSAAPAGTGFR